MHFPNLFVIGAPKRGTTSVASWLSEHSRVFMCTPQEPSYFSHDIQSRSNLASEADYRTLFSHATDQHLAVGEASTTYLRSAVAISEIVTRVPNARLIVCVRNPVEMAISVHGQLVAGGSETETNFSKAWELQSLRSEGKEIPKTALNKDDLQYGEMCKIGSQLSRLLETVDRKQVLIMFLDKISLDPRGEWLRLQNFLSLPDDGRQVFKPQNTRRRVKAPIVLRFMQRVITLRDKLRLPSGLGVGRLASGLVYQPDKEKSADKIDDEMREKLNQYFAADIALLRSLSDLPNPTWLEISK